MVKPDTICHREFDRIMKKKGRRTDFGGGDFVDEVKLADLTKYEETVIDVISLVGLTGWEGLHWVLSFEFEGDPGYKRMLATLRRIGAWSMYRSFGKIVNAYYPKQNERRAPARERKKMSDDFDTRFFAEGKTNLKNQAIEKLALYITENKSAQPR